MIEVSQEECATIHIIDDDDAERESVSWFLRGSNIDTKTYASATIFLQTFNPKSLGVILLDIQMPEIDGIELLDIINYKKCLMPVIMLSGEGTLQNGVQSMKGGALDFLEKPIDSKELLECVLNGLAVAHKQFSKARSADILNEQLSGLTKREREIYNHTCQGETNKVIGNALDIHLRTVEFHRGNMMRKMKVNNLEGLIKLSKPNNIPFQSNRN